MSQSRIFPMAVWMVIATAVALGSADCGEEEAKDSPAGDGAMANGGVPSPGLPTLQLEADRRAESERLDPRSGPWRSEVFAEEAGAQLQKLAAILQSGDGPDGPALSEIVSGDSAGASLRPLPLEEHFQDQGITVLRSSPQPVPTSIYSGPGGAADMFRRLLAPLGADPGRRVALKISRVTLTGGNGEEEGAETSVSYDASGGRVQQTATWICRWKSGSDGSPPMLTSVSMASHEEVESAGDERWFHDITAPVLGGGDVFREQLGHGLNHWLSRIDRAYGINYFRRCGLAIGDADGDGLDDIYVSQPGGLPNRLFLHQPDGTVVEASGRFEVDWLDHTSSALFVDLDNDGDQDLALAVGSQVQVLENHENRKFRPRARLPMIDRDSLSLTAADYDLDGDLDLFVCVGFADKLAHASQGRPLPGFVFHDARDGGRNVLFRNDGDWRFADATREAGLDEGNHRHSLAAAWEDYDRDGDIDLYVANDYGPNALYRNDNGRFQDVAETLGVLDSAAGMSVSWGDYNRDGWMDLYIANMYSYAGSRIGGQPEFLADTDPQFRSMNRRFSKGNSLFRNSPGGAFTETGAEAGVERGRWAWGSLFADINNDGWEDLFITNGYITTEDSGDL